MKIIFVILALYYLLIIALQRCLFEDNGFYRLSRTYCNSFKDIPYNIRNSRGTCVISGTGLHWTTESQCKNKLFIWFQYNLRKATDEKYVSSLKPGHPYRVDFRDTARNNQVRRIYGDFGLSITTVSSKVIFLCLSQQITRRSFVHCTLIEKLVKHNPDLLFQDIKRL